MELYDGQLGVQLAVGLLPLPVVGRTGRRCQLWVFHQLCVEQSFVELRGLPSDVGGFSERGAIFRAQTVYNLPQTVRSLQAKE